MLNSLNINQYIYKNSHTIRNILFLEVMPQRKFIFNGNNHYKESELLKRFQAFGGALSFISNEMLTQEIINFYKSKGFLKVKVAVQSATKITTIFVITEGECYTLRSLSI